MYVAPEHAALWFDLANAIFAAEFEADEREQGFSDDDWDDFDDDEAYSEAYADVAGDACLAHLLTDGEDPRRILSEVRRAVYAGEYNFD